MFSQRRNLPQWDSTRIRNEIGFNTYPDIVPIIRHIGKLREILLGDRGVLFSLDLDEDGLVETMKSFHEISKTGKMIFLSLGIPSTSTDMFISGSNISVPTEEFLNIVIEKRNEPRHREMRERIKYEIEITRKRIEKIEDRWFRELAEREANQFIQLFHNVLLVFTEDRITHYDSMGVPMREDVRDILRKEFPEMELKDALVTQQDPEDHANCSLITTQNMLDIANGRSVYTPNTTEEYLTWIRRMRAEFAQLVIEHFKPRPDQVSTDAAGMKPSKT